MYVIADRFGNFLDQCSGTRSVAWRAAAKVSAAMGERVWIKTYSGQVLGSVFAG